MNSVPAPERWFRRGLQVAGLISLLLVFFARANLLAAAVSVVHVEPRATDELLANPGMGWQTFMRFADQDKNLQGLPSSSAYFRFYWREVEPRDGEIDFARFDELLAHARRCQQKLAFRIMCTGSEQYLDVPQYLKDQGCRGFEFKYEGSKHWVPDFTDPLFQKTHFRLIRELGRRYGGHPDLDLVDIGSVGLWGEWHMSGTIRTDNGEAVAMPPVETRMAIIDAWCQAFPQNAKVMLIGSDEGMASAQAKGYGWRADCLGDMGGFSKTWNHMDNYYLQQLTNTSSLMVWKSAPVAFESCWDMRKWTSSGWDIRHIFDYALQCHAGYLNNKSAPIPEGTRPEIERFLRRLGYRLVVRSLDHAEPAKPGESLRLSMTWENVGVAPPYGDYRLAFRLSGDSLAGTEPRQPIRTITTNSVRGWLPGLTKTDSVLRLPTSISEGRYRLAVGLVAPETEAPAVRLAIAGREPDGWYPLSRLEVR
jgi:hypothetical protein